MDYISHLKSFIAVVHHGSFSDAARAQGLVPSMVAKRIGHLEAHLKTRLFERTTRKVNLTESGERFHTKAIGLLAEMQALFEDVESDDGKLQGHIRLMVPTTLGIQKLGPKLNEFMVLHPRISLEVALVDSSTNPSEAGFDLSISGRLASYDGVVDIALFPVRPVLCASPHYLKRHAPIAHPRELVDHAALVLAATGKSWQFQSPKGLVSVEVRARLTADDNMTILDAALRSLGVAILPQYVVQDHLNSGSLVKLLEAFMPQENGFKAYVPKKKMKVARVMALIEWLKSQNL